MIILQKVPHGLNEINAYYGNPDLDEDFTLDIGWAQENIQRFTLPYEMKLSWNSSVTIKTFQAHKLVGPVIVDALEEILAYAGLDYLQDKEYDFYGGCWNFRRMTAYPALSTHAFAAAIDINPHIAAYGMPPETQPEFIVMAFKKRGFEWGGDWPPKWTSDAQHFQAMTGY